MSKSRTTTLDHHLEEMLRRVRAEFERTGKIQCRFECMAGSESFHVVANWPDRRAKAAYAPLRDCFRRRGVNRYVFATEAWAGKTPGLTPTDDPNRGELVLVIAVERNGPRRSLHAEIMRAQGSCGRWGAQEGLTPCRNMNGPAGKLLRCAIYTRKSSEHNLDLAFTSLDAQREACEAYIKSQAHEGWRLIPDRYDDGAFSGASLDRRALQKLLADVRAGTIDIVLVYKVDRLTRSLADFAKVIELFDAHNVSFVSVTQSFNTSSSMGRLTLNVLLSFAQFEREVIGERVRDKIAASKRKGIWVGGPVPLGYAAVDRKIVVIPAEAEAVRTIFARYLELGSVRALAEDLDRRGIRSKARRLSDGRIIGGSRFGVGALAHLLKNRFYIGEVVYRGEVHGGEQRRLWIGPCSRRCRPSLRPRRARGAAGCGARPRS